VSDTAGETQDQEVKKKSASRKLIVLAAAAVAVIALGCGGAVFVLSREPSHAGNAAVAAAPESAYYELADLIVTLADRRPTRVKAAVTLELDKGTSEQAIKAAEARIVDAFRTYLGTLPPETAGSAWMQVRLKADLLRRARTVAPDLPVKGILFRGIIVQ
jgi:flagellar basal body-associated protein FliL